MTTHESFTTEKLTADLACTMPGPVRTAEHLLKLDTPRERAAAKAEGNMLANLDGWRPSDAVAAGVAKVQAGRKLTSDVAQAILDGTE